MGQSQVAARCRGGHHHLVNTEGQEKRQELERTWKGPRGRFACFSSRLCPAVWRFGLRGPPGLQRGSVVGTAWTPRQTRRRLVPRTDLDHPRQDSIPSPFRFVSVPLWPIPAPIPVPRLGLHYTALVFPDLPPRNTRAAFDTCPAPRSSFLPKSPECIIATTSWPRRCPSGPWKGSAAAEGTRREADAEGPVQGHQSKVNQSPRPNGHRGEGARHRASD